LNLLCQSQWFQELCTTSAKRAAEKLGRRLEQLRLRANRIKDAVLQQEILAEKELSQEIISGIQHPHIRLDSVGFIIISGRDLQLTQEDNK